MARAEAGLRAAFYALAPGGWRDYVTVLHPPYTAWHLSYVVLGAALVPHLDLARLGASLGAFALAVGVAAHCLDELRGRPLGTRIPERVLVALAAAGLGGAVVLGLVGLDVVGWPLAPLIAAGVAVCLGYNLELGGGRLHNDATFALAWGGFPVLAGGIAQDGRVTPALAAGIGYAIATSHAQRRLSSFVRPLRRGRVRVEGQVDDEAGTRPLDTAWLVAHADAALSMLALAQVLLAVALVAARA
jgi:hypothetical protein